MTTWLSVPESRWIDRRTGGRRRKHRTRWSADFKEALSEAQNHRCCICGVSTAGSLDAAPFHANYPTIEHVLPLVLGGADHPENLVMTCYGCNTTRGYYCDLAQFGVRAHSRDVK